MGFTWAVADVAELGRLLQLRLTSLIYTLPLRQTLSRDTSCTVPFTIARHEGTCFLQTADYLDLTHTMHQRFLTSD